MHLDRLLGARERLTFANVMSVTAVFIALGGSAWALTRNSVGPRQIKPDAVRSSDIKENAVKSPHVANGSLLGEDFAAGQLPQGPQGEPGPEGPAGAVRVTVRTGAQVTVNPISENTATADCLPGERATGGGWELVDLGGSGSVTDFRDRPIQNAGETPVGWRVVLWNPTQNVPSTVRAFVLCAGP